MSDKNLTETEELLLQYLEESPSIKAAADKAGLDPSYAYSLARKLKDVIQERTRDNLTFAGLRASGTLNELLDADAQTQQGALRQKVASDILDRMGATKHTSVDVSVESSNGIFILPGKAEVEPEVS